MRSFKKIAAMIMAVAMLCSFTVLGASVSIGDIALDGSVATIPYTTDVDEVTALVYSGTNLSGANLVYIDQFEDGFEIPALDLDYGTYTVVMGGLGADTGDSTTFEIADTREYYTITIADPENGYIKCEDTLVDVLEGTEITLTFAPFMGYALESFTIGGETVAAGTATNGVYTYTHTVTADAEIAATFAEVTADSVAGDAYISGGIYDIAADETEENEKDRGPSKLTFGKAVAVSGKTIKYMGMKVEVWSDEAGDYVDFTTPKGAGPLFRATNPVNNVYGIRFFGFAAGSYRVSSYVQYEVDGVVEAPVLGDSVEFVVG